MTEPTSRMSAAAAPAAGAQAAPAPASAGPASPASPVGSGFCARPRLRGPGPRVIGLDLSLTATGVADVRDGQIHTGTIATHPYGPGLEERTRRIWYIAERIWRVIEDGPRPALVVVEGPSYGSRGGQAHERAGLWWHVISGLLGDCLPVAVVPPAVLKRYAVGKGTATKPDMRMALYKRAAVDIADDNQVDAWWLAAIGLDHLGRPPAAMPAAHRAALDKVDWPGGEGR